jgi:hypothetical protein
MKVKLEFFNRQILHKLVANDIANVSIEIKNIFPLFLWLGASA